MSEITKRAKPDSNLSDGSNLRRSKRIQNAILQDVGLNEDPVSLILPELIPEVYKYCSNSDLCRFRLVSSSWKNSVEEFWRKRVTMYVDEGQTVGSKGTSTLPEFSATIQNEEFDFSKHPLRKIKFHKLQLTPQNYKPQSILVGLLNFCGSAVSHLEVSDCAFENGDQFLHNFLSKFCNIKTLILTRLMERSQMFPNKGCKSKKSEDSQLPVLKNLSNLKIDYSDFSSSYGNSYQPCQLPWLLLLSSTPNLETLKISDCKKTIQPMGFTIVDVLLPVEWLSLEKKLEKLQHIEIYNDITTLWYIFDEAYIQSTVDQSEALQRSSIVLKSLKFNVYIRSFGITVRDGEEMPFGNQFMETLLQKFGKRDLQNLQLSTWKTNHPEFPPAIEGMSLENLTHLSLNLELGKTIKSAEKMPNLKSLEIWCIPPQSKETYGCEGQPERCSLRYLPADYIEPELTDEDCPIEDPDYYPGDFLPHDDEMNIKVTQTMPHNQAKYVEGNSHNALFWEIDNPDASTDLQFKFLTHFRFESKIFLPQKLYLLPTWMPNLTSLEIPLTASDFTTVCDKMRNLQRLVILHIRHGFYQKVSSFPIDDCVITGKQHNFNSLFVCSCKNFIPRPRRKQSLELSYLCGIGQPAVKPNITYLQELRHFEMEGFRMRKNFERDYRSLTPDPKKQSIVYGFHRSHNQNIYLTDESVFDGFFKLPKLTYLCVSAKLSNYTRKELFKRIPKCIVRWPAEEESDELYCTMQNFERDNVV